MKYKFLYSFVLICFIGKAFCNPAGSFVKTKDGIMVYPDQKLSGNVSVIRLQVINNYIIRVTASSTSQLPDVTSLISVVNTLNSTWNALKNKNTVLLKTAAVTASVDLSTGAISFFDKTGKPIISEKQKNGRKIIPAIFEGQRSYAISQTFQASADDSYYGLGQHQSDQFNYKGQQVLLYQNNTEVAVPFLVSSKNYGILWDNYSITKVGDVRDFLPLSGLKLYTKQGEYGWLTASYCNNRDKPNDIAFVKAESEINYPFVGDTKTKLPADFNIEKGMITYEGSIASDFAGMHKFKINYAGYCKVWLNGKLLENRWRQAWNPGTAIINFNVEKNKKYPIKIEWIPDGGESYLAVKWLNPIEASDANAYTFSSEAGKQLDYYFIYGNNIDEVISGYRSITGKATIVPKWAMGFWQSRERYKTQDELLNVVDEFRKRKIPLDNIVLDWSYWKENDWGSQEFDASRFSNPDSMISVLHNKYNTHFMISVWPKFYEGITAYNEFDKKGWLYKRNIADRQRDWIAKGYVSTFYDAFNNDAKKGFWNLINKKLFSKGVDAWWMDASEPDILSNVSPERRKAQMTPTAAGLTAEYVNAYPLENAKGIYFGQRSVKPDQRVFLLTRSGFAGSQHYAASIWSGDIASRWEDMKAQISAGINYSMSGLPFWTMDIGGFAVERRYENAKDNDLDEWRELQTRWYQFGSFAPLFRVHGQYPFREIFNIAPEDHPAYKSMLYYDNLRYRLMPYIYTLAAMTYHNDYTIMRGLVIDFSKDTAVKNIGDQYMFGPSLLISPVYDYKAREKKLYLPSGTGWFDFYSGKYFDGGQRITSDAPYERMPVFVKEGSIIPAGPAIQYTSEKPADSITLRIYVGKDASFTLYEDEGTNYNYEKGGFSNISFFYDQNLHRLTIGKRKGNFTGMITNRVFNIVWINKEKQRELNFESKPDAVVHYKGDAVIINYK
ncbi:MAG TPA: TIM-barrel domain-containing protein [Chitinophagaceae bacterium]